MSLHAYILLDRSGSMSDKWAETLSSINAYVQELAKAKATKAAKVTVATFDLQGIFNFDVIRKAVSASRWPEITDKDAQPRGWTPLYDAVGRLVSLADTDKPEKAVLVIMTDGRENCSHEVTRLGAKTLLDRAREKGWQVLFLGADFDVVEQAADVGTAFSNTINTTKETRRDTMRLAANYSTNYAATGAAIAFSTEDRKRAAGDRQVHVSVRG